MFAGTLRSFYALGATIQRNRQAQFQESTYPEFLLKWLLIETFAHTRKIEETPTMPQRTTKILIVLTLAVCAMRLEAQMPNPYGPPIGVENAKKAAAAALA